MGLLLVLARRGAQANAGHAEFACTAASGRGRAEIPARILAVLIQPPRPIRGTGAAAFPVTDADGTGRAMGMDDALLRLLLSAA